MVSEPKTIEMQRFQGTELDSGRAIGVSTQNPEMRKKTASRYKGSHDEAGIEALATNIAFEGKLQTLLEPEKQRRRARYLACAIRTRHRSWPGRSACRCVGRHG